MAYYSAEIKIVISNPFWNDNMTNEDRRQTAAELGFPTRFLPKPKNRVTRSFFKTEKPVLAACKPVFFRF